MHVLVQRCQPKGADYICYPKAELAPSSLPDATPNADLQSCMVHDYRQGCCSEDPFSCAVQLNGHCAHSSSIRLQRKLFARFPKPRAFNNDRVLPQGQHSCTCRLAQCLNMHRATARVAKGSPKNLSQLVMV